LRTWQLGLAIAGKSFLQEERAKVGQQTLRRVRQTGKDKFANRGQALEGSVQKAESPKLIQLLAPAVEPNILAKSSPVPRAVWQRRYGTWLQVTDLLVISAAVVFAQLLRFGTKPATVAALNSSLRHLVPLGYSVLSILIIGSWVWFLMIYHTREPGVVGGGSEEFRRVWTATLSLFGGIAIASTIVGFDIARGYLAIALPLGLVGLSVNRFLARKVVAALRRRGRALSAVLAVGEPESVRALAESLARHREDGYTIVAACAPGQFGHGMLDVTGGRAVPLLPYCGELGHMLTACGADTVVLTSTAHLGPRGIHDLSWQLDKIDVDLVVSPAMIDLGAPRLTVRPLAGLPFIQVAKPRYDGAKGFQKRAFDVCFSLFALVVALPVMLVAAVAIKLTSKGPVFYTSERIGLDSKPFRMIKFRSMVVDADQQLLEVAHLNNCDGLLFKARCDPRVTSVGRFLRRYSLDELPQFINVLRRDMSVVGPRPPLPTEAELYDHQVRRRLLVRPGITGLWQVRGRSDLSWQDSVRLDESYVENWSMLGDLAIALATVLVVFRGAGAY
jgi:exopolysaccharide biosynthesis polyprenyl glycosylphosphotransferase